MYRILTIDGGGIKGVFPVSFLKGIEDALGDKVCNYFDLIVGTSTGGIIALGLGMGHPASEILHFYEELGPKIFVTKDSKSTPKPGFLAKTGIALGKKIVEKNYGPGASAAIDKGLSVLQDTLYDAKPLQSALKEFFGKRKLGESITRVVIPSFNISTGQVNVYKTAHHPRFQRDYLIDVAEIAAATSAAPIYFPTHLTASGLPMIDGGIYANNPVGLAVVEAISVLGWKPEEIQVLSIGCTNSPFNVQLQKQELGIMEWGPKLIEVFMAAQSSASYGTAQLLADVHKNNNVVRIDPSVPEGRYGLDKVEGIVHLKGLGDTHARTEYPKLKEQFFSQPVQQKFDPFYKL